MISPVRLTISHMLMMPLVALKPHFCHLRVRPSCCMQVILVHWLARSPPPLLAPPTHLLLTLPLA